MVASAEIVFEISGNAYRSCYQYLQMAVGIAHEHLPTQLSMKEISDKVVAQLNATQSSDSVARALARATEDAWDHGGRQVLESKYGFRCKPTPKELIFKLARSITRPMESQH